MKSKRLSWNYCSFVYRIITTVERLIIREKNLLYQINQEGLLIIEKIAKQIL